jgi:predicted DNA-binding protein with PD1-like motif
VLPDAVATALRHERVTCGWLRASGVLRDVELRAFDAGVGTLGSVRRVAGPVQVLALEGSIGLVDGEPSFSLRALLARETDRGLETLAGEITHARIVALEALVTSLDDVALERALDESAGVWLLDASSGANARRPAAPPQPAPAATAPPASAPAAAPAWSAALEASEQTAAEPVRPRAAASAPSLSTPAGGAPMPARPRRPDLDLDTPAPEPGDSVEHFAFGRGDVLKSDGDRLHIRVHKDGRIREIALEMLRVSSLPDDGDGKRHFKLERRL